MAMILNQDDIKFYLEKNSKILSPDEIDELAFDIFDISTDIHNRLEEQKKESLFCK